MATVTKIRKRTRVDPTTPAVTSEAADIERGRLVLSYRAQGLTQEQIGQRVGRDVRTVRRWETQAREMGLSAWEDVEAGKFVVEVVREYTEARAELRDLLEETKIHGDRRQRLKCIQELLRTTAAITAVFDRAGALRHFELPIPRPDPVVEEFLAGLDRALMEGHETFEVEGHEDDS